jgi:predicted PurR-regulated permease PerM
MIRFAARRVHGDIGGDGGMTEKGPSRRDLLSLDGLRTSQIIRVTATITVTVLVILGLLQFLVQVRTILLWVLIGIILAIALQPAVGWLQRHGWNRILAALVVSFATIAILLGAVAAIALPVVLQSDNLIRDLPHLVDSLFRSGGALHFLEVKLHILRRLSSITPGQVVKVVLGNQQTIVSAVTKAAFIIAATITILTIMVMLLIEGPRGWTTILDSLVGDERRWIERIGANFLRATGGYVRGNLAISLVAGLSSYIVLKIIGTPYAETLAVLVAILDIIPLVGATIGAVIVTIVGWALGGIVDGVVLIVFFVAYQQFENNVLQNIVYAKTLKMSPLVIFVAALIGATLAGIVGVLLAIPLASAGWTLARDLIALRTARRVTRTRADGGGQAELFDSGPPPTGFGEPGGPADL